MNRKQKETNNKINEKKIITDKIVFVTGNSGKFKEIKEILEPFGFEVIQNKFEAPEIQADELEPIAAASAKAAAYELGLPVLVDDSGLFIETLNGFPGPYSRFVQDHLGNEKILKLMNGETNRNAYFKTVVAYCRPGEEAKTYSGIVRGQIAHEERGCQGFGYDPIFEYEGKTFGELENSIKNKISHRRRAVDLFLEYVKEDEKSVGKIRQREV